MSSQDTNDLLNRLLVIHYRSLPVYLRDARPWTNHGALADEANEILQAISSDHLRTVDEVGELLNDRGVAIDYGKFPLAFTGYHDLSFDFLIHKLVQHQRQDLARIEELAERIVGDMVSRALAERSVGAAKGHLDTLQELQQRRTAESAK